MFKCYVVFMLATERQFVDGLKESKLLIIHVHVISIMCMIDYIKNFA